MSGARRALLLGALAWPACLPARDFPCQRHDQCGAAGTCEVDGRCSAPDPLCASGRRYVEEAGGRAGQCVGSSCPGNPLRAFSAGARHACALRSDGAVWCWGLNDDGQLGDGSRTPRSLAVKVPDLTAVAVAAGDRHTCAVRADGAVLCWGADDAGQLGDGGGATRATPAAVDGVTGAVDVASGKGFSCAVLGDGNARCWGDDTLGQLGDGAASSPAEPLRPVAVAALSGIRTISAHWQHACALRDDETVWCWGANSAGQLGDGSVSLAQSQPVRVQPLAAVTRVATGFSHTCAATRAAGLYCWGANNAGQLARDPGAPQPRPVQIPVVTDPVAVAAGAQHTCAIRQGGAVLCWGGNTAGQLGDGTTGSLPFPVAIAGPSLVAGTAVLAGEAFSCAAARDGAVFCWGDNHYGQLAVGSATARPRPVEVAVGGDDRATAVAAGAAHTCAALDDGRVSCWGANQAGQLGDSGGDSSTPVPTRVVLSGTSEVTAGDAHSCARAEEGDLFCWGRGSSGQLGPDHLVDTPFPASVAVASVGVASVAAGAAHTCAALTDNTARCWGANGAGQLGDGTNTGRPTPAAVAATGGPGAPPLPDVLEVVAGGDHTCARLTDGSLRCWGANDEGQLGDGSGASASVPTPALLTMAAGDPAEPASQVSAGAAHTCALDDTGRVWCWGRGAEGQLGLGAGDAQATPRRLPDLPDARAVAAGGAHTCAVDAAGAVWCWGANFAGQLGLGTADAQVHAAPARVVGLPAARAVATGGAHTCAVDTAGAVWCWGANFAGQLGDGVMLIHSGPLLARLACDQ